MALTREQMDLLANGEIIKLYDEMERYIISDIARRVQKTGRLTETAEIMARNLREQGYSPSRIMAEVMKEINANEELQREIAENTKAYKQGIKAIIEETEKEALEQGNMLVANAAGMSWNDDVQMWEEHGVDLKKDKTFSQIIEAYQKQTQGALSNITRTTGVALGNGMVDVTSGYRRALDLSLIKMISGGVSFQEAMKHCIYKMASDGVHSIDYGSKRKYHLDTSARMCLRTAMSQLSGKITESNMNQSGTDLVYVDAHAGSRPEHAIWQGAVYLYNLDAKDKNKKYKNFWDETDYGSPTGLKGINCMHNFFPWWEGDPIPEYKEPDPIQIDGKDYTMYEATQEQRRQERAIRATKRELDAAKALGDKEKQKELQRRLSEQNKKYNQFSVNANLRPKTERTRLFLNKQGNSKSDKSHKISELEQRKSKLSKTVITDVAIKKVPLIKISGYTKEQLIELQKQHKELLIESRDMNNSNEVVRIFGKSGTNVVTVYGTENSVNINASIEARTLFLKSKNNEIILIHNHPKGSSFSYDDIGTFLQSEIKTMTIVTNKGKVYVLNKKEEFDILGIGAKIKEIRGMYKNPSKHQNEIAEKILKSITSYGVEYIK